MKFELWLAFVAAFTVVSLIPGPSVLVAVSQALTRGKKAAFYSILGDICAGVILIAVSLAGAGAILAASAELYWVVKWGGVLFMAWLGYRQIVEARRNGFAKIEERSSQSGFASVRAGFMVGVMNPKAILFYVAFVSQFLDQNDALVFQFMIIVCTSAVIVAIVLGGYALLAAKVSGVFRNGAARRNVGYAGGTALIGGSFFIAATR